MSDTVKSWIEERRAIHAASGAGRWEKRLNGHDYEIWELGEFDDTPVSSFSAEPDASAIVDDHNMFPRALGALKAVIEQIDRMEADANTYGDGGHDLACDALFAYVVTLRQAIEGAINE